MILWLVLVALLFPDCTVTVEDVVASAVTSPTSCSHKTLNCSVQDRNSGIIVPLMFIFPATQEASPDKGNSKKRILINKLVTSNNKMIYQILVFKQCTTTLKCIFKVKRTNQQQLFANIFSVRF